MKKIKKIFIIILILINILALSFAHPGRTDSNGGHYNRKTGEYHYHDGRYAGQSQSTTIEEDEKNDENTTSWEEYKQKKNLSYNKYRDSDDVYLQNKTIENSTITTSSQEDKMNFFDFVGYALLVLFVFFPFISIAIALLSALLDFIKNKFFNEENHNTLTTNIVSTDYTVSSNTTQTETNKPIIKTQNNYICPKCGGQLQLKNGKYGRFIGCKNYPNCKYTKNLKK